MKHCCHTRIELKVKVVLSLMPAKLVRGGVCLT